MSEPWPDNRPFPPPPFSSWVPLDFPILVEPYEWETEDSPPPPRRGDGRRLKVIEDPDA